MAIYYLGPSARITHEVLEVWCPAYRAYLIRDLSLVRIELTEAPMSALGVRSAGLAGATAVLLGLGRAAGWAGFESPVGLLTAMAVLLVSAVVTGACWWARPRERKLVARYRDRDVILYHDPDRQRLDQVARALTRALETAGGTRAFGTW